MYEDGWLWSCRIDRIPWRFDPETIARLAPGKWNPEDDRCELYDLTRDFSQARDLAAENPAKLSGLEALFWSEAERYQVLPLLGGIGFVWGLRPAADLAPRQVVLTRGVENLAPGMIPPLYNRSFWDSVLRSQSRWPLRPHGREPREWRPTPQYGNEEM